VTLLHSLPAPARRSWGEGPGGNDRDGRKRSRPKHIPGRPRLGFPTQIALPGRTHLSKSRDLLSKHDDLHQQAELATQSTAKLVSRETVVNKGEADRPHGNPKDRSDFL
jgi:hypothetical protein